MENIHSGHRERMKARFSENGLAGFSDVEALELLLFYAIPRRNTNELAHELINRFGSFRGVMEADIAELGSVAGIGDNAAILIRLTNELNHRYMRSSRPEGMVIKSSSDAGEYILPLFSYKADESVYILCLNSRSAVCHCQELASGMSNKVHFTTRSIVDIAIQHHAARMIIAHNHLSGTALPSEADISSTRLLKQALGVIGVELIDHIIVCDDDFVSMKDTGCL